jgi:hypothetical protein
MNKRRSTSFLLAAAAVLMVPSAAANDTERSNAVSPGPWLELVLSEAVVDADPGVAELHERARRSLARLREPDTERR